MKTSRLHITRSTTALTIKITAILLASLALYSQDLAMVANEAVKNEMLTHILAIPFLFAYLLYRKRKMLQATIPLEEPTSTNKTSHLHEIAGTILCVFAFFLYWHGSYTFSPLEYHMISLPIFVAGLILVIFNSKTLRVLAFPIAFLLFLTPPPIEIAAVATSAVSAFSAQISYTILKTAGMPVSLKTEYYAPALVVTDPSGSSIPFVIGEASSGIYSLIGFTVFAAFLIYIARGQARKRAFLFAAGLPIIYTLNIVRIIILVSVGYSIGVELAWDIFHTLGGWILIFLGSAILLFLSEKALKLRLFQPKLILQPCPQCPTNLNISHHFCEACGKLLNPAPNKLSRSDLYKMTAIAISMALILSIQVPVFALTQGPPEALIQTPMGMQTTTTVLPTITGYELQLIYRDTSFEAKQKQDASLMYAYVPINTTYNSSDSIWVGLEIADSKTKLSHWEGSLVTWRERQGLQPLVNTLDLRDIQLLQNPPIIGRLFAFQYIKTNLTQVVLYWRETTLFRMNSTYQQRYTQISVAAFVSDVDQYGQTEDKIVPLVQTIVNYWQPIKSWSPVAIMITQQGYIPIAITLILLVSLGAFHAITNRKQKRLKRNAFYNLSMKEEKIILTATNNAARHGKPTANAIISSYGSLTGRPIELTTLTEKLNEAEKTGLVTGDIVNEMDEPIFIWRADYLSLTANQATRQTIFTSLIDRLTPLGALIRKTVGKTKSTLKMRSTVGTTLSIARFIQVILTCGVIWFVAWAHIYEVLVWNEPFIKTFFKSSRNVLSYVLLLAATVYIEYLVRKTKRLNTKEQETWV